MSYLLYLVRPTPGKDPVRSAKAIARRPNRTRPRDEDEQLKQRLAQALVALNPLLHVSRAPLGSRPEPNPEMTLFDPATDSMGISITLSDLMVSLEIHFGTDPVGTVLGQVRAYLEVLQREGGYAVYDPQNEQFIDPATEL